MSIAFCADTLERLHELFFIHRYSFQKHPIAIKAIDNAMSNIPIISMLSSSHDQEILHEQNIHKK